MLLVIVGCMRQDTSSSQTDITVENPATPESAFTFDKQNSRILLDTRIAPPQRRDFGIGQGSVTLETIEVKDGHLTFYYTPEIEGGYTTYECTVPVSASPITIKVNRDGTPGEISIDLTKCRVVKSGNVHWE